MPVPEQQASTTQPTRGVILLRWLTLVGPLLIAFGQQQLAYMLVDPACRTGAVFLVHLPAILGIVLVALLGRSAWREVNESRKSETNDDGSHRANAAFFGIVGLILCGLAAVLIIAQWLPDVFLHPCQR
jgi:hypothetical protein